MVWNDTFTQNIENQNKQPLNHLKLLQYKMYT